VTYYLHPTFIPSNITITTEENRFATTFTNWGKFDLWAKVYFKDGIQDLELTSDQWSEPT
jgi:transcription initiation factor IIF auxiliary subunit